MKLNRLFSKLKDISDFFNNHEIHDIYTNSKIYELLMAEQLGHQIINGHANTPDACDVYNNIYEYKHYKESSGNHSWTFNDFSENTIGKLNDIDYVIFATIDDSEIIPYINKMYLVDAKEVANYLAYATKNINNSRDMINIRPSQIERNMKHKICYPGKINYSNVLTDVFVTINQIEKITGVQGLLTSNKLWELLVSINLDHRINSEQKKHDAIDDWGNTYEYKISGNGYKWTFQDISENVLNSYLEDEAIVLAIVDKDNFVVTNIFICDSLAVVDILKDKLEAKSSRNNKIKRLSVGFGKRDLKLLLSRGEAEECHL